MDIKYHLASFFSPVLFSVSGVTFHYSLCRACENECSPFHLLSCSPLMTGPQSAPSVNRGIKSRRRRLNNNKHNVIRAAVWISWTRSLIAVLLMHWLQYKTIFISLTSVVIYCSAIVFEWLLTVSYFVLSGTGIWIRGHRTDLPGREEHGRNLDAPPTGDWGPDDGELSIWLGENDQEVALWL